MNPALIAALIEQIVVPEIAAIVRAHHNATGKTPTDTEILAALQADTSRYIQLGEAFLASKGATPAAPASAPA